MIRSGRSITAAPYNIFAQIFLRTKTKVEIVAWYGFRSLPRTGSARKTGSYPKNSENSQIMWYFCFLKYAVSRRKTLVLYLKWCVQSDSEARFRLTQQRMKKIDIFFHSLSFLTLKYDFFFGHFRLPEVIETPTKPQFQPLSMSSKRVWANILSEAAVIERPDWFLEKNSSIEIYRSVSPVKWNENYIFWVFLIDKISVCTKLTLILEREKDISQKSGRYVPQQIYSNW